jgi:hypothetical protein
MPPQGPHTVPVERWVETDTPPPPVQVEEISARPSPQHLWIDGGWSYQKLARRWSWEQGRWCIPPPDAIYFAPSESIRFRKAIGRVVRWNEARQRYEEVDQQDDRWRWTRGRFYTQAPDGAVRRSREEAVCAPNIGFEAEAAR